MAGLPLHPAADIYYHRNDLVTSERLGRVSFVASGIAALAAAIQFFTRFRRSERLRNRRRLLGSELSRLQEIRHRIDQSADPAEAQALIREADDLLGRAEHDAAAELLDASAIASLRSVHEGCWRALDNHVASSAPIGIGTRGSAPRRKLGADRERSRRVGTRGSAGSGGIRTAGVFKSEPRVPSPEPQIRYAVMSASRSAAS